MQYAILQLNPLVAFSQSLRMVALSYLVELWNQGLVYASSDIYKNKSQYILQHTYSSEAHATFLYISL